MGLDMYLYARTYVSGVDYGRDEKGEFTATPNQQFKDIVEASGMTLAEMSEDLPSVEMSFKIGYWRKANQIHQWFVNEVQDGVDECQPADVNRDKLVELRDVCRQVLADHSKASELLPTGEGFFFGSYEYDEWYFEQIEYTVQILDRILSNPKFEFGKFWFVYQSSW